MLLGHSELCSLKRQLLPSCGLTKIKIEFLFLGFFLIKKVAHELLGSLLLVNCAMRLPVVVF